MCTRSPLQSPDHRMPDVGLPWRDPAGPAPSDAAWTATTTRPRREGCPGSSSTSFLSLDRLHNASARSSRTSGISWPLMYRFVDSQELFMGAAGSVTERNPHRARRHVPKALHDGDHHEARRCGLNRKPGALCAASELRCWVDEVAMFSFSVNLSLVPRLFKPSQPDAGKPYWSPPPPCVRFQ